MNKLFVFTVFGILIMSVAVGQNADNIIGKYQLPNQLDIEIFKADNTYKGKIIGLGDLDSARQKDIHNPDKALRNDPLLGKIIITNLQYDKVENEWVDGSMYGPEKGLIFNLRITAIRESEIEVVGSKYFFWKTLTWKKL